MPRRILLLAGMLAVCALGVPTRAMARLHAGDVATDFRGTDLDGNSIRLSDYHGQVVILFVLGNT